MTQTLRRGSGSEQTSDAGQLRFRVSESSTTCAQLFLSIRRCEDGDSVVLTVHAVFGASVVGAAVGLTTGTLQGTACRARTHEQFGRSLAKHSRSRNCRPARSGLRPTLSA